MDDDLNVDVLLEDLTSALHWVNSLGNAADRRVADGLETGLFANHDLLVEHMAQIRRTGAVTPSNMTIIIEFSCVINEILAALSELIVKRADA